MNKKTKELLCHAINDIKYETFNNRTELIKEKDRLDNIGKNFKLPYNFAILVFVCSFIFLCVFGFLVLDIPPTFTMTIPCIFTYVIFALCSLALSFYSTLMRNITNKHNLDYFTSYFHVLDILNKDQLDIRDEHGLTTDYLSYKDQLREHVSCVNYAKISSYLSSVEHNSNTLKCIDVLAIQATIVSSIVSMNDHYGIQSLPGMDDYVIMCNE